MQFHLFCDNKCGVIGKTLQTEKRALKPYVKSEEVVEMVGFVYKLSVSHHFVIKYGGFSKFMKHDPEGNKK